MRIFILFIFTLYTMFIYWMFWMAVTWIGSENFAALFAFIFGFIGLLIQLPLSLYISYWSLRSEKKILKKLGWGWNLALIHVNWILIIVPTAGQFKLLDILRDLYWSFNK